MSPLSNRQRGDYFERQTRDALRAAGWFVIRAAGSKGVADLVALRAGQAPLLVSCKLGGRVPPAERQALWDAAELGGGRPVVALRETRGRVHFRNVLPDLRMVPSPEGILHVPPRRPPEAGRPIRIQR